MGGNIKYRITLHKAFDQAVRRVAGREGISVDLLIKDAIALYGAFSNLTAQGTKIVLVHPDGNQEEFYWDRGSTSKGNEAEVIVTEGEQVIKEGTDGENRS